MAVMCGGGQWSSGWKTALRKDKAMSRRHELDQRLRKLEEIGEIMRSMKNLALMETRKLAHFLEAQEESVRLIESAAADFLLFHPAFAAPNAQGEPALLLIGAERGFCGDFNEELLRGLEEYGQAPILAVGGKLCARLEKHPAVVGQFDGPAVAEDVPAVLNHLVPALGRLQQEGICQSVIALYHAGGESPLSRKHLLPPFAAATKPKPSSLLPPLLNLPPPQFFAEWVRHYLFAVLHALFYASLMAENQRRIQHLEGAVQRMEEKTSALARQSRILRQEEITEEIEVILLSVEGQTRL
jgi:F-type H+-transporting ATPase subunit gamma